MSSTPRRKRNNPHSHPHTNTTNNNNNNAHGHQRDRSQRLVVTQVIANQITSDYESDTASYMASHPPAAAAAQRTNEEINMTVLRRHLPTLSAILSVAAHAVVYVLNSEAVWEKANMEGTLFVCQMGRQSCVFVLNRKGLDNLVVDLENVKDFELADPYLMLSMNEQDKIWGIYIHADEESTRVKNARLIESLWKGDFSDQQAQPPNRATHIAHTAQPQLNRGASLQQSGAESDVGGRQLSLNELFRR